MRLSLLKFANSPIYWEIKTFAINFAILLPVKLEKIEYEGFDWDYRNRFAFVAFTIRTVGTDRLVRPISARYIHRGSKEDKIYEKIRKELLEE